MMSYELFTDPQVAMAQNKPYCKNRLTIQTKIDSIRRDGDAGQVIAREASQMLSKIIPEEEKLDSFRAETPTSWYLRTLGYDSPFLVAVAIALRVTRVSAEVFALRRTPILYERAEVSPQASEAS
jgi:hypothetical protein